LRRNQAASAAAEFFEQSVAATRLDFFSLLPGVALAMLASPPATLFQPLCGFKSMQHQLAKQLRWRLSVDMVIPDFSQNGISWELW
jgi:hypothetical protein